MGHTSSSASPPTSPKLIFLGSIPERSRAISTENYSFAELMAQGSLDEALDRGTQVSNLFTTSGSTSAPKVASHDQASILRHSYAVSAALDVEPGDRLLAALPLCGVFGFSAVMALLIGGGSAVMMETFDAGRAAHFLEEHAITHVVGGDDMLGALFGEVPEGTVLPGLRRGAIANFAGHAKDIVSHVDRRWGARLSGVYGSSELFALSAVWPASTNLDLRELSGGLVVDPGIHVRVRELDSDQPAPDGTSGELQFRGYNVSPGYVNNALANGDSFTPDGWFKSGDLGYIAHGGFVYQCRSREALRLHGFLVEPGEIEDYLSAEKAIEEVHVVGVETETGTRAVAFARARAGESIDEYSILTRARQHMAAYKVPERLFEVTTFPTTTGTNGTKIRFDELRELALVSLNTAKGPKE
jgi:fatty-acyl-CoA synthase